MQTEDTLRPGAISSGGAAPRARARVPPVGVALLAWIIHRAVEGSAHRLAGDWRREGAPLVLVHDAFEHSVPVRHGLTGPGGPGTAKSA
jgi:hypothetical protein